MSTVLWVLDWMVKLSPRWRSDTAKPEPTM